MPTPHSEALASLPIFKDLTSEQLDTFLVQFDRVEASAGWELFPAGDEALHLDLLIEGSVIFSDEGKEIMRVSAPAIIGELGVLTGMRRNTTAKADGKATLLRVGRDKLMAFLQSGGGVSFRFYQNLLEVLSDKVKRDKRRLDEMRSRIIATQRDMKGLHTHVLDSPETPISGQVDDFLETNIGRNRRVNYTITPPRALRAEVRTRGGQTHKVWAISRTNILLPAAAVATGAESFEGVLVLPDGEIPVDGTPRHDGDGVHIELSLLIDDYVAQLEDYLTRSQILDVVV